MASLQTMHSATAHIAITAKHMIQNATAIISVCYTFWLWIPPPWKGKVWEQDPKFPVCVTLPRRSIVRERAGSAASARRQGRCDGCIFMAGIISKNQSARQARSCPSLRRRRKRREDLHLDNAGKFHLKFTVAVPEVRAALHDAGACRHVCKPYVVSTSCQRTTLLHCQKRSRSTLYLTSWHLKYRTLEARIVWPRRVSDGMRQQ